MKLLIELDDGRLLSELAREQVINDFTAFSYVSKHIPPSYNILQSIGSAPYE